MAEAERSEQEANRVVLAAEALDERTRQNRRKPAGRRRAMIGKTRITGNKSA